MARIKITTTVDEDLLRIFKQQAGPGETISKLLDIALQEHIIPDLKPQSLALAYQAGYNDGIKERTKMEDQLSSTEYN